METTVQLSVSDARVILDALRCRSSGPGFLKPPFFERLEFAVWEAQRDRPQKLLIEVVY